MQLWDDMQLLHAYVADGSEAAFETIVSRHLNLVYSTALRQVSDPVLASEVTQTTFIILARKAGSLSRGTILSGWLYRTAQFAAARAIRTEVRRREREKEAVLMQTEPSESMWEQLAPLLDQAMAHLGATDRDALVLRYFENKTARDVGHALGINEAAAQKRLARAVEKLRAFCAKKGVVLTAASLTALLSANAVQAAPASVAVATTCALKTGALHVSQVALARRTLKLILRAKFKFAALTSLGVATVAIGTAVILQQPSNFFEPRFQGKGLSQWLAQLDNHQNNFYSELPWTSWQAQVNLSPAQAEAAEAIRALGTNAVPQLIATLAKKNLSLLDRLMGRELYSVQDNRRLAALALDALGPVCKPWVPELTRLLDGGPCPKEAAVALAAIGPDGWEILMRTARQGTGDPAACAIWSLGSHHVAAPKVEETLLACYEANHPDGMDIVSLWALTEVSPNHGKLIPLLIEGLHAQRSDMRWGSAVVLGRLGSEARVALPELWRALNDTHPMVRQDAAQAITQIDPQSAAQAGLDSKLANPHLPKTYLF